MFNQLSDARNIMTFHHSWNPHEVNTTDLLKDSSPGSGGLQKPVMTRVKVSVYSLGPCLGNHCASDIQNDYLNAFCFLVACGWDVLWFHPAYVTNTTKRNLKGDRVHFNLQVTVHHWGVSEQELKQKLEGKPAYYSTQHYLYQNKTKPKQNKKPPL